jgi:hypothetical protein
MGRCLPKNVWLFVYGMTTPDWAAVPLDAGTQEVMRGGIKVLFERGRLLLPLEELNFLLMFLCGFARVECAEVATLSCFWILLFGIQAIFA